MGLAAVDGVTDALAATRAFLLPFDAGQWLRLAVIAFFVGGAGGAGSGGGGGGGGGGGNGAGAMPWPGGYPDVALSNAAIAAIVGLVVLLLLVGLVFAAVGAVMEFVLVESLRREAVHLRRYLGRYWRPGLRLFGFRLVVGLVGGGLVVGAFGLAFLGAGGPSAFQSPVRLLAPLLLALPVALVVALVTALALGLTTAFVVPVMLLEGTTVLGGWRRFWPTLRAHWREYAVYVVLAFLLRLGLGLLVGLVVGGLAVAVLLPLGAVGFAVFLAGGGQLGPLTVAVLALLGLVAVVVLLAASAVVGVPVVTYLRYYALLVLGDTDPALDVVADRRAAIRGEAAGGGSRR